MNGVHSMSGHILTILCVGFASGVFIRSFFDWGMDIVALLALVSFALVLVGLLRKSGQMMVFFASSLLILFCAIGIARMEMLERYLSPLGQYVGEDVVVSGRVVRDPEVRSETVHLHIEPIYAESQGRERLLVIADRYQYEDTIVYGDVVRIEGVLEYPEPFETDGGRVFDYIGYLRAQGVFYIVSKAEIEIESTGESHMLRGLYYGKHQFMESLEEILPHPHSGLGEGILLGVKSALGDDLSEAFRKTGIIHIVVLSGYNVLIVVEAMMYLLAYFFRPRTRMVCGILGIVSFAFLVGFSATVVRACIMASILVIARGMHRMYSALRALGIAGVVMVFLNPHLLVHDIGFQLSFLATLGLILFSGYFEKRFTFMPTWLGLRSIFSATIATQIAVLPILLYHTGMFSLVSILVNMLVLPMVPLAMLFTFLTGMIGLASSALGSLIGYVAYLSLSYIIMIAERFGDLSFSAQIVPVFPFWVVVISYVGIGVWYMRFVYPTAGLIDDSTEFRIRERV